ncbi:MAG: hypothetical protein LBI95_02935 [Holosporales bacterium]|nr:hypothetical protein [Holosporales bacterium]
MVYCLFRHGPCRSQVMFEAGRMVQAFKSIIPRVTFMFEIDRASRPAG